MLKTYGWYYKISPDRKKVKICVLYYKSWTNVIFDRNESTFVWQVQLKNDPS